MPIVHGALPKDIRQRINKRAHRLSIEEGRRLYEQYRDKMLQVAMEQYSQGDPVEVERLPHEEPWVTYG